MLNVRGIKVNAHDSHRQMVNDCISTIISILEMLAHAVFWFPLMN